MPRIRLSSQEMKDKMKSYSTVDPVTGCWNWIKGFQTVGYGSTFNGVESLAAHKASYEAFYGEINKSCKHVLVLHKCNNRKCVNPEHLYIGTRKSNMYDALAEGSFPSRRVLRKEDREFIKYLYSKGLTMRYIAKMYLTNHPQISRAIKEGEYAFS